MDRNKIRSGDKIQNGAITNFEGWHHESRDSTPCNWNTWHYLLFYCYCRHSRRVNSLCQITERLLSPRFLEKASGILLSPPSVCPFVRPSVCYAISSQTAGQNPTKFGEWLAYTSGACKSTFIFGPAHRGPGKGSKGQILTISNFKVNFKDFYAKMCTYTQ